MAEGGHDHHDHHDHSRGVGDYVRDFFSNWGAYHGPFATKVALTLRNRARAYTPPFRGCCGHPGEPGC